MAILNKKKTDSLTHIDARTIKGIGILPDEKVPMISFTSDITGIEQVLPMTTKAWSRAAKGTGATIDAIRNGLNKASRYRFQILTEGKGEGANKTNVVVGIHCIPDDNYIQCDFAATLNRPMIAPEDAVVKIHEESGEIDIIAFPSRLRKGVNAFLHKLEKLTTISESTMFTVAGVHYVVSNMFGGEVTFRCRKIQR